MRVFALLYNIELGIGDAVPLQINDKALRGERLLPKRCLIENLINNVSSQTFRGAQPEPVAAVELRHFRLVTRQPVTYQRLP